jgi:hypothetical protein
MNRAPTTFPGYRLTGCGLERFASLLVLAAGIFLAAPPYPSAAEKTVTLRGRVDVAGLDIPPGPFTVKALQPQQRAVELGKTTTNNSGDFELAVDEEALALYGVVLEAASAGKRSVVLEAVLLRSRDAGQPIAIGPSSTLETAILSWKIQANDNDFDATRPGALSNWLRPISEPKTRDRLKRAYTAVAKWAAAAATGSQTTATVLRAAVGDIRFLAKRLGDLGVSAGAVAELTELARKDPEVAYVLMMPYFLDL